ncbi:hypothetical protein [Streptomyces sp. NPDC090798]|uniref:hypothetical protein n=1 Tax=Streptomyces sp. NPDC090798 TaxID=3365968 RepID=UPI0037FB9146
MPEAYPTPLAGQRLTAGLLRSMQPQVARKTADTARFATTTLALDPHIQFTAVAGAVYAWSGWLKFDADLTGDIIVGFSVPSGSLGAWVGSGAGTTVISGTAGGGTQQNAGSTWGYTVRTEWTDIGNTRTYGGLGAGNALTVMLNGTLRVGATGGTWGMTWAQSVSSATATTVFTDSWISSQRIA